MRYLFLVMVCIPTIACGSNDDSEQGRSCTKLEGSCDSGFYCKFPEGDCGEGQGTCESIPEICTQIYAPVCGCDRKTYGSSCQAAGAGISILKNGECESEATPQP